MQNFFGHLKEEGQQIIEGYVHFYNCERIQLKTKQTPYETSCLSS